MSTGADARLDRTTWLGRARKMATVLNGNDARSAGSRIVESRSFTLAIVDAAVVYASYAMMMLLRFRGDVPSQSWESFAYAVPFITTGYLVANAIFGRYRGNWRYGVRRDTLGLGIGVTLVTGAVFAVNANLSHRDIPLSVNLLSGGLVFIGLIAAQGSLKLFGDKALLASRPQFLPRGTAIGIAYWAVLGLIALISLVVTIWFIGQLVGYQPLRIDDSRTILYASQFADDPYTWFESQAPFLQYLTYLSLVALFGWDTHLVLVPLLFSAALALLVGYLARLVTGGGFWAFLAGALAMASMPIFLLQAHSLPFYPPTLFFGYCGVAAAVTYARYGGRAALALATLGLAAALYSYAFGVIFLLIPLLYVLIDHGRAALARMGSIYAIVTALVAPWMAWHLAAQGLDGLHRQRLSWMVEQGYTRIRNIEFYGRGSDSPLDFLEKLPHMFDAAGPLIFAMISLGIIGLIRLPTWPWRTAVALSLAIPTVALVYLSPAAHGRYIYYVLPGMVILSVYGLHGLLRILGSHRRTVHISPIVAILVIALLGVLFARNARDDLRSVDALQQLSNDSELIQVSALIDDGRPVLGSRVPPLIRYERQSELLTPNFVPEEDFVTYLTWPSEESVAEMFLRNDVGWLLIQRPAERWERDFHIWLKEAAGQLPQHYLRMEDSRLVEKVYEGEVYALFRVVATDALPHQTDSEPDVR